MSLHRQTNDIWSHKLDIYFLNVYSIFNVILLILIGLWPVINCIIHVVLHNDVGDYFTGISKPHFLYLFVWWFIGWKCHNLADLLLPVHFGFELRYFNFSIGFSDSFCRKSYKNVILFEKYFYDTVTWYF